jgi:hypothetical protein
MNKRDFELQTPRERLQYFNTRDYPGLMAVSAAVNGPSPTQLTPNQSWQRAQYLQAINQGNYRKVELDKFFPLDQVPVDTEASMRKEDQGLLFRSEGPQYAVTPYLQKRSFGGWEPLPYGFNYQDPQATSSTRNRNPDLY